MDRVVQIVNAQPIPTAVVAETTTWADYPSRWPALLDEVWAFARAAKLQTGRNVMLYKDGVPNVEVGIEVTGSFVSDGRVILSALPAGAAAMTVARGAPSADGIAAAHQAVFEWASTSKSDLTGVRWEIYDHWQDEQDPSEYRIEIYWLLA